MCFRAIDFFPSVYVVYVFIMATRGQKIVALLKNQNEDSTGSHFETLWPPKERESTKEEIFPSVSSTEDFFLGVPAEPINIILGQEVPSLSSDNVDLTPLETINFNNNKSNYDVVTHAAEDMGQADFPEQIVTNDIQVFYDQLDNNLPIVVDKPNVIVEENIAAVTAVPTCTAEAKYSSRANSDDDSDYEPDIIETETANNYPSENDEIAAECNIGSPTGRPKKGRKLKIPNQNRKTRSLLCQTNQKYISQRGKVVNPKEFCDYQCRSGCHEKVSLEKRRKEFKNFWELSTYEGKALFIASKVTVSPIKRKRTKNEASRRSCTRTYTLAGMEVCKMCFTKTLRISGDRVNSYLKKTSNLEVAKDNRGKAGGTNRLPEDKVNEVIGHINKIPKYKSHYCRSETSTQYLPSNMTTSFMYELYKSEHANPVSISSYKKIFYSKFNLKRKPLKKDTCNLCDSLHAQIENERSEELTRKLDDHQRKAEEARNLMKSDLQLADNDKKLCVLTYDLQRTLPLPRIPTNIVFYKRQLWLYNCGIHSGKSNRGFCFVWLEGQAGRGAQEVGSCLRKFILQNVNEDISNLILWSDSCGGQNRNIKMVLMLKAVLDAHPSLKTIKMRFLISGHSFLPNDDDFGDIESALKLQQRLYSPDDYIKVMQGCRSKNKLIVTKMEKEDFFGTNVLEKQIVNRKKDIQGNSVSWLKTREIEINKDKPYSIILRQSFDGNEEQEINLKKRVSGRQSGQIPMNFNLEPLWPNGKPISQPKLDDLKSMMHLIPTDSKQFYRKLYSDATVEDDIDGFDGELDFIVDDPE